MGPRRCHPPCDTYGTPLTIRSGERPEFQRNYRRFDRKFRSRPRAARLKRLAALDLWPDNLRGMVARNVRIIAPIASGLLATSLLAGASGATTGPASTDAAASPGTDTTADVAREFPLPRHDLVGGKARARWSYKYAAGGQNYSKGKRPTGLAATFTVHRPKQVKWRKGDHSLAEVAIARPGGNPNRPSYIEAGWVRGNYDKKVRLFVFWWGLKGGGKCYNMRCKGFVRSGKGKRPGAVLKPGTKIRLRWVHRNNRWNLFVNGKRSGYYPDRLWKNKFKRIGFAQLFGEVAYSRGGRCIDMGTGRFPRKRRGAAISNIRVNGKAKANFRKWTAKPGQYRFKRINKRAFRYGGPGPC